MSSEQARLNISGSENDTITAVPHLKGKWLLLARMGWIILALCALAIFISSLPGYARDFVDFFTHTFSETQPAGIVVFAVVSALASLASALISFTLSTVLFRSRFEEPVAASLAFYLLIYSVVMAGPLEAWNSYWYGSTNLAEIAQTALLAFPTLALLFLFPNGRFVPAWTRWVLLLAIPWNISLIVVPVYDQNYMSTLSGWQLFLLAVWYLSFIFIGLYAQFFRYRHISTRSEKQQTKWVIFGFTLWLLYIMISTYPYFYLNTIPPDTPVPWWAPAAGFGWFLALNIVPLTLTISVTRYKLWDIDVVINRALLVGMLTISIITLYVLIVGAAGIFFQTQGNWLVALAATGLVAVLFHPLRLRLQRWANRLVYGQRDEPFEVLSRLGQQLEGSISPELVYPTIVSTVAQTLKLPYAEIATAEDDRFATAESYGKPSRDLVTYPLTHQGETVGELRVARRSPNEDFAAADDRLLQSIARQAGSAVHAAQLTTALQHSRRELVSAREEERRRLRRDLHDGLGPQLASQTLGLDAALKLIDNDPQAAKELLRSLRSQSQGGVQDIRRLVYGLRPPALDELGLVGALRESTQPYQQQGLQIDFQLPKELPDLPAAVEVAAYRIVQEAITNVARHARATFCQVHLSLENNYLLLQVEDNGQGLPADYQPGIGLLSMQERSAELNGRFHIESTPGGGTQIKVKLPL
ncbi:MAG: GAF domain-containing sensor histidine kinase [Candidatus Promineifilaceae bacterium]|nr:GAF domain-containing sensor histidine kinase [Candidatus Promineifilaceae bacterium]